MKNIQVIDAADNCTYSIYEITDEEFALIFPNNADVEFIEDLESRLDPDVFLQFHSNLWKRPIEKTEVFGIHGTLFYELSAQKRRFYPKKRFYDNVYGFAPNQRLLFKIE